MTSEPIPDYADGGDMRRVAWAPPPSCEFSLDAPRDKITPE